MAVQPFSFTPPAPTGTLFATSSVAIINPQYCSPDPVDLTIVRKVLTITNGNFVVTDINNNVIIFKVRGALLTVRDRHVLIDAAGNPVVTFKEKIMTAHQRWKVFRGESVKPKDLIFSVKRSAIIQLRATLHVFLAKNTKEDVCDFRVEGDFLRSSCTIYAGQSSIIVAQMDGKLTLGSLIGKSHFSVRVQPNIDYAFIVALIVILERIREKAKKVVKRTIRIVRLGTLLH